MNPEATSYNRASHFSVRSVRLLWHGTRLFLYLIIFRLAAFAVALAPACEHYSQTHGTAVAEAWARLSFQYLDGQALRMGVRLLVDHD